ncbi:MAG: hypothetical protein FRX49_04508 [Trebouxia sp. A1-2]|nr:MAG: hypothetical protein FRX49_04508 [Trebouxia sp. A1-2]
MLCLLPPSCRTWTSRLPYDSDNQAFAKRGRVCSWRDPRGRQDTAWYWRRLKINIMDPDEDTASTSLRAYYDLLREYRGFTVVWIGEIIDNVGNWLNYVATLSLVEQLAGGRGLLISALLIVRFLPTFLLFPIAGVVADRIDRPKVLLVSCVVNVFIVLGLALIRRPDDIWAMYVLLFLQFTSSTFYDPARRALEPKLVPKKQLHLATTLDTFAWSVTVAVGSSLGGAVVSKLGTTMCFVLDSCTFLCAALCVLILQVILRKDGYVNNDAEVAEEAEQLLAPLDSPVHSHTIPELAIVSQVLSYLSTFWLLI